MPSISRRRFVIGVLVVSLLAGLGVNRWRRTLPEIGLPGSRGMAAVAAPSDGRVLASPSMAAPPDEIPTTKTVVQLHAALRESQRCLHEAFVRRANLTNDIGAMRPIESGCDDMKTAERRLFEATRAAARAGDLGAQMCYLMQQAGDRDTGFMLSDVEIAEFQSEAPRYVGDAFRRGDWRVVNLLGFHVVDWAGLFVQLEPWRDPLREYKAYRLLLLGVGAADAQGSDQWLPLSLNSESTLSAEDIRDSDAWAHEMYDKYFSSQPRLIKEPTVCTDQDGTG
jgi:hypothetical protein